MNTPETSNWRTWVNEFIRNAELEYEQLVAERRHAVEASDRATLQLRKLRTAIDLAVGLDPSNTNNTDEERIEGLRICSRNTPEIVQERDRLRGEVERLRSEIARHVSNAVQVEKDVSMSWRVERFVALTDGRTAWAVWDSGIPTQEKAEALCQSRRIQEPGSRYRIAVDIP